MGHMITPVLIWILCQIFLKAVSKQRRFLSRSESITCAFKKTNFESNEDYKGYETERGKLVRRLF